jgi:sulfonate dioxygenase
VSLWDNRVTAHTAISDYDTTADGPRHGIRLTTLGEKPVGVDGLDSVW